MLPFFCKGTRTTLWHVSLANNERPPVTLLQCLVTIQSITTSERHYMPQLRGRTVGAFSRGWNTEVQNFLLARCRSIVLFLSLLGDSLLCHPLLCMLPHPLYRFLFYANHGTLLQTCDFMIFIYFPTYLLLNKKITL